MSRLACVYLLLVFATPATAQTMESRNSDAPTTATHHAPAIWLAQGEPFYPMLPHPFAFDGIDNDGDGCYDLADPDEVGVMAAPELNSRDLEKKRLEDLLAVFGRLLDVRQCVERGNPLDKCVEEFDPQEPPVTSGGCRVTRSIAKYHVCGRLWGTGPLRCGPPPAVLYGPPRNAGNFTTNVQDNRSQKRVQTSGLMGIQFWLHYPWDAGHLNDGEHVSVFYWSGEESLAADIKAVVGAGHDGHTANNVLFASTSPSTKQIAPRRLPPHMPFLVELGKHASAPDLNCDGQFEIGVDANDGPQGAWGSRDSMVSINKKIIGPFQGWMSYERDGSGLMIADVNDREAWLNACPQFTRGRAIIEGVLDPNRKQAGVAVFDRRYRLLDALKFQELDQRINKGFDEVVAFINANRETFWDPLTAPARVEKCGATMTPGCVAPESWEQFQNWHANPKEGRSRRDVWTHGDFWQPQGVVSDDFKRHLYPRFAFGSGFHSVGGNMRWAAVARVAGVGPFPDSGLELAGYIDGMSPSTKNGGDCNPCLTDVSATYDFFRTSYTGFYLGAGYHLKGSDWRQVTIATTGGAETAVIQENPGRNVFVFAGVALSAQVPDRIGQFKIKFLPREVWKRSRVTIRIGVQTSFEEGNTRDPKIYSSRSFAQLQVGATWTFGFSPGKHPLSR
jgi:hypothetical protein